MNPHSAYPEGPFADSLATIRRLDERGTLYEMETTADYYDYEAQAGEVLGVPGCSVMVTPNVEGEILYCRNYDFFHYPYGKEGDPKDLTGLSVIVRARNPQAKYRSLGVADAYWLDVIGGTFFEGTLDDGVTDVSRAALLPFLCMDAANDAGLAVSILALPPDGDWVPTDYVEYEDLPDDVKKKTVLLSKHSQRPWRDLGEVDPHTLCFNTAEKLGWEFVPRKTLEQTAPGKPTMAHSILMRRMVDFCGTVEEAIALAENTNVKAQLDYLNFHLVVADRSGRSVVMEWVDGELRINDADHVTNFYLTRRGDRSHGGDRYDVLEAALARWPHGMPEYSAKGVLQVVAANLPLTKIGAMTYWSSIYNLEQGTMKLWNMCDYDRCYEYSV